MWAPLSIAGEAPAGGGEGGAQAACSAEVWLRALRAPQCPPPHATPAQPSQLLGAACLSSTASPTAASPASPPHPGRVRARACSARGPRFPSAHPPTSHCLPADEQLDAAYQEVKSVISIGRGEPMCNSVCACNDLCARARAAATARARGSERVRPHACPHPRCVCGWACRSGAVGRYGSDAQRRQQDRDACAATVRVARGPRGVYACMPRAWRGACLFVAFLP